MIYVPQLGADSPPFLGEGSPSNRLQKKQGTLILTFLLEDVLVGFVWVSFAHVRPFCVFFLWGLKWLGSSSTLR